MICVVTIPPAMVAYCESHGVEPAVVAQCIMVEHGRECADLVARFPQCGNGDARDMPPGGTMTSRWRN